MRSIKQIHKAVYEPISDLVTYRAIPSASIDYVDPFLFLNHHGPQVYPPNNRGLPFGPHPHRGFETVTFIIDGDIYHKDSGGNQGTILPGGVQWMTAGSGLIHSEISSQDFKKNGGKLEILQLWVNLPARHKMAPPAYKDLQKEDIPVHIEVPGEVTVYIVSGNWKEKEGAYQSISDVHIAMIEMKAGKTLTTIVAKERNVFFYMVKGQADVNGQTTRQMSLVEFENDGEDISFTAIEDCLILFGHALPYKEPVVSDGPFVMNTEAEIREAFTDYQAGKMGVWQ
ncbi:pirin family protein [soil metagenome]